jgi:hypothetical protein
MVMAATDTRNALRGRSGARKTRGWIWARVGVSIRQHPRWMEAELASRGFWTAALCWLREFGSDDGALPRKSLANIGSCTEAEAATACKDLVRVGLFGIHDNGDYQFLRYAAHNETGQEVQARRDAGAKRQQRYRDRHQDARNASRDSGVVATESESESETDPKRERERPRAPGVGTERREREPEVARHASLEGGPGGQVSAAARGGGGGAAAPASSPMSPVTPVTGVMKAVPRAPEAPVTRDTVSVPIPCPDRMREIARGIILAGGPFDIDLEWLTYQTHGKPITSELDWRKWCGYAVVNAKKERQRDAQRSEQRKADYQAEKRAPREDAVQAAYVPCETYETHPHVASTEPLVPMPPEFHEFIENFGKAATG